MKSKFYLFSLLLLAGTLLSFIIKGDFKNYEPANKNEKYAKEKYEKEEHEQFENEKSENEEAELKYRTVTVISPEKQNQIWDNLDAMHKNKTFSEDRIYSPWYATGPVGIRDMYSPDYLHKYSGRCMMVDFDRNGNFWVGSAHGGLWAGPYILYPIPVSEGLNTLKIGAFATHPSHDSDYFVGTGLFRPFNDDPGTGLWRWTGSGPSFVHQNLPDPNISWFSSIKIHAGNPNIVLAASSNGIFRTSDNGTSWNKIICGDTNTGDPSQRFSDLQSDPSNPDIMYAVRNSFFIRGGIYKSTNAGLNWTSLPTGITNIGNSKIAICKNNPALLFANITYSNYRTSGVYKSTNAGASWTVDSSSALRGILGNQGFNNCGITVCPNDPSIVIAGGQGMARSTNGGTAWTQVSGSFVHADVTSFAWKNNDEVWSTSDGGLFKSTDKGATWTTPDNIMMVSEILFLAISPSFELDQAIGVEHNGVCVTHSLGNDYRMTFGGDGSGVAFNPFDTKKVYCNVGAFLTGLPFRFFKSSQGGDFDTWSDISSNILNPCGYWYQSIKTDKQSPPNLYTSVCTTVWKSTNDGDSWINLNTPSSYITDKIITVNDNGVVFAIPNDTNSAGTGKLLVYSGSTWSDRTPPGTGASQIQRVKVHPRNQNTIFALTSGTNSVSHKIFRSTNLGVNWTNITGTGLDDVPMADMIAHPTDPNKFYVGTQGFGFFGTTNGGTNWYPWNNGAQKSVRVTEMAFIDSGFVSDHFIIYAATYGRGVYIRDLSDDPSGIGSNNTVVDSYQLRQNYPNPFNPTTTIEFNMKKSGIAKMEVFDLTGKLVATIVDGYRQEGRQNAKFSGYGLASGVYFYKFTADSFTDIKKMMLVK
ncbi:MAG: T9SS type A sorting domain-containing protein [Bacteroidetes bacterium]|nr:T9SS type A sorting domain-containing protein [Bacteroidota bacterium]